MIARRGTLVVVSAPSGAGKTTLCHEVRSVVPSLYYSVSYTTRTPRPGEVDGTDFHFVDAAMFIGYHARIGSQHSGHISPYLDLSCVERSTDYRCRVIRTTAAQCSSCAARATRNESSEHWNLIAPDQGRHLQAYVVCSLLHQWPGKRSSQTFRCFLKSHAG